MESIESKESIYSHVNAANLYLTLCEITYYRCTAPRTTETNPSTRTQRPPITSSDLPYIAVDLASSPEVYAAILKEDIAVTTSDIDTGSLPQSHRRQLSSKKTKSNDAAVRGTKLSVFRQRSNVTVDVGVPFCVFVYHAWFPMHSL